MAGKIAERIRRNIEQNTPWLMDDSKTGPLVAKLQQELTAAQGQLSETLVKYTEAKMKLKGKDELRDIEVEDMLSRRLTAESNAVSDLLQINEGGALARLVEKTLASMLGFSPKDIEKANQEAISEQSNEESDAA